MLYVLHYIGMGNIQPSSNDAGVGVGVVVVKELVLVPLCWCIIPAPYSPVAVPVVSNNAGAAVPTALICMVTPSGVLFLNAPVKITYL